MAGLADIQQQVERIDYKGKIMIGRVVENNDPKHFHRIKVQIPDLLEDDVDSLPWAIPECLPGGAGAQSATQNVPMIGSTVYVWFQDGDTHFPVYRGQSTNYETELDVLAENYPNRVGWHRQGHHSFTDFQSNLREYKHVSGFIVQVTAEGNLIVNGPKDATVTFQGNVVATVNGNVTASVKGNVSATVQGNVSAHANGNLDCKADGSASLTAGGALALKGSSVTITGGSVAINQG